MLFRGFNQAGLNGAGDATVDVRGKTRQVVRDHFGMVQERRGHLAREPFQVGPDLLVGQGFLTVKRCLTLLCETGKRSVLLGL